MKYLKILLALLIFTQIGCSEDTIPVQVIGTITGTVLDAVSGDPLSEVKITTNPSSSTVFTDELGAFILADILADDYSVQAELDGYISGFEAVTVTDSAISSVAFDLETSSANNKPPSTPELLFPEDEATDITLEVEFRWSSTDPNANDEVLYSLELRNGVTNEIELFEEITDSLYVVSNLQLATTYFWQVTADDEVNDPVTSFLSQFTTLSFPDNPFLFVKEIEGNNVIFSGSDDPADDPDNEDNPNDGSDFNVQQLTNESVNSFRPKKNLDVDKIAYLRNVGVETHLFLMNLDGTNQVQLTSNIPVTGFRLDEINYAWSSDGSKILYPYFDKIYEINLDGGGNNIIYQTTDGSFVSEIASPEFNSDILVIKTNNLDGYDVRIFTYDLTSNSEVEVILENTAGAAGSIDIMANADKVLYTRDLSGSENTDYRRFESRMFIYDISSQVNNPLLADTPAGENELEARFSPTDGAVVYTRVGNNQNATPAIYGIALSDNNQEDLLFTDSSMPDWE
jgi:hypothetical protein